MRVTKREILVSIIIIFIMISVGLLISQSISSNIEEQNEVYHKALKIEDLVTFEYATSTNIGNCFTIYVLDADSPQSIEELSGEYLYIERIYEEEHRKSRIVTETYRVNGKTRTRTKTVYYWEWDVEQVDKYASPTITLNGDQYQFTRISGYPEYTLKLDSTSLSADYATSDIRSDCYIYYGSHQRYSFRVVPCHSEGSTYVQVGNNTILSDTITIYPDTTVSELYESLLKSSSFRINVFWVIWIILTIVIVAVYCYQHNDYLEDNSRRRRYYW